MKKWRGFGASLMIVALFLANCTRIIVEAEENIEPGINSIAESQSHESSNIIEQITGGEIVDIPSGKNDIYDKANIGESQNEMLLQSNDGDVDNVPLSGIEDITPPTVSNIEIGAESVEAPGALDVTVEAYDDVSGAVSVDAKFRNINTDTLLSVYMSKNQEDGKFYGVIDITEYISPGQYKIDYILVRDMAGNSKFYYGMGSSNYEFYKETNPELLLPESLSMLYFTVINNGAIDITAPIIKNIFLDKEEMEAPGSITITTEAEDDLSGVDRIRIEFRNPDIDESLSTDIYNGQGTLEVGQYVATGNYIIDSVMIMDKTGNYEWYYGAGSANYNDYLNNDSELLLPDTIRNLSFSVINKAAEDISVPIVEEILLGKNNVEVPAIIDITIDAMDDISGVSWGSVYFRNPNIGKSISASFSNTYYDTATRKEKEYEDGKLHGELDISHYAGTGNYMIDYIVVRDNAENVGIYYGAGSPSYSYYKEHSPELLLPESLINLSFYVYNDDKGIDVSTSTTNPDLLQQIENADNQAEIRVDYSSNPILGKDIFKAIKGTEKTVSLVSGNGVQWIFSGSDITDENKDVDLKVDISYINQSYGEGINDIKEIVDDTKTVVLRFPENGVLPGKATIRVKADYSMRQYLNEEGIYVYFFDNTEKKLVPIAENIRITSDHYIEFDIEHCSSYIMTRGKVAEKEPPAQKPDDDKQDVTKPDDNNSTPIQKPEDEDEQEIPIQKPIENSPVIDKIENPIQNIEDNNTQDSDIENEEVVKQEPDISPKTGEESYHGWYFGILLIGSAILFSSYKKSNYR